MLLTVAASSKTAQQQVWAIILTMNEDQPSSPLVKWAPTFDAVWKLGLVMSIGLYGLGLVISNFHAQQFGRYTLGLNQADYIIAGLLWSSLATFGYVMVLFVRRVYDEYAQKNRRRAWSRAVRSLGYGKPGS